MKKNHPPLVPLANNKNIESFFASDAAAAGAQVHFIIFALEKSEEWNAARCENNQSSAAFSVK
jgi:hypothetical protein